MTPTEKDAMALAAIQAVADWDSTLCRAPLLEAKAHLASRIAELEMVVVGVIAAYERFTAYTITHNGAMRYCSSDMRDAYAEMRERATRAEAELVEYQRAASMFAVEKAEQRIRADKAEEAGKRVLEAFRAHGKAAGIVTDLRTRRECEAAILNLELVVDAARGGE